MIVPTFRRTDKLINLLQTLEQQITDFGYEVIVVNDAEDEDISWLNKRFPSLNLSTMNLRGRHGRPIARNHGAKLAKGDVLIFVDDDMTVNPGFVDAHLRAHTHPKIAAVGRILTANEIPITPLARYIEYQGLVRHLREKPLPPKVFRTGNASVAKATFVEVGMFDESITTYGEDMDLAMRLSYAGTEFVYAKGAIAYHHDQPNIDDFLAKIWEWGRYTLPKHAERHPQFAKSIWLHLALPLRPFQEPLVLSIKKILMRIALLRVLYKVARLLLRIPMPQRLGFALIDYLRVYTYIRGYRQALIDQANRSGQVGS